ncbi:response regulator transcription factor [Streptomyces sp. JJ38]|nr:response regulator transcription factor [Streptomyces sp. JJ38]
MLVRGLTDRAVARRLGLSERTVRRMVAHLMDRLGAASRFEAGARAVERGWLD